MSRIYLFTGIGVLLSVVCGLVAVFLLTRDMRFVYFGIAFSLLVFIWGVVFAILVKQKLSIFTWDICQTLDHMMHNKDLAISTEEETLFVKINHRLIKLYDMMKDNRRRVTEDKATLEALITDISHQVKTPISNLKLVNATLIEKDMPKDKQREFLQAMDIQIAKLDFLMQSMIKTSRLEIGMITLDKQHTSIYETLAAALGGIVFAVDKKNIEVSVSCSQELYSPHDKKWTTEALFNILDNAVKYTHRGGHIEVNVECLEMYTRIDITDNGKGISEYRQPEVFKRFYREEEVHDIEGIGIGLYLAREIITIQGGYIKLTSEVGKGSTFSIFLPQG